MKKLKSFGLFITVLTLVVIIVGLWRYSGEYIMSNYPKDMWGILGDMFGAINSLFSGLALFFIIISIFIQGRELKLQKKELKLTRYEHSQNRLSSLIFKKVEILNRELRKLKFLGDTTSQVEQLLGSNIQGELNLRDVEYHIGAFVQNIDTQLAGNNYKGDKQLLEMTIFIQKNYSSLYDLVDNVTSLPTGSKIRVLATNHWIISYTSYDKKARPIYSASYNEYLDTKDKTKSVIDFIGNQLRTESTHQKGSQNVISTIEYFEYDHQSRLKSHNQSINGQPQQLITKNAYDELGQLISKDVGGVSTASAPLQKVNYSYTIRGWLKGINRVNADNSLSVDPGPVDLFNFEIGYDKPTVMGTNVTTPLYNGNISETVWRTPNVDQDNAKAYAYEYDALNRLTQAAFTQVNQNNIFIPEKTYKERIDSYDKNGNILSLFRTGDYNADHSFVEVYDDLNYAYDGNQLINVTDTPTTNAIDNYTPAHDQGFKDGSNNGDDYAYDVNGNMIGDQNKGITSITYNHLNLPTSITIDTPPNGSSGGTSQGTLVFEDTFSDGNVSPWLKYPAMPENPVEQSGAIRAKLVRGVPYAGAYIQEAIVAGHLHTVTFEVTSLPVGYQSRLDIRQNFGTEEHVYVINNTGTHTFSFISNGGEDHYFSFATNQEASNPNDPSNQYYIFIDNFQIMDDDATSGGTANTTTNNGVISYIYDATGMKLKKEVRDDTQVLLSEMEYAGGYIYVDSELKMIPHPEGYVEPNGNSWKYTYQYRDIWGNERLSYSDLNGDGSIDPATEIKSEKSYYPFGLVHRGYNSTIIGAENNFKQYQGQEFTEDLGLNTHEWKYRFSDPAIGRFWQIDPLAEDYVYNSTYAFQENKMGLGVELEGLELGDYPDLFESNIGAQESENRLLAQISAEAMVIASEVSTLLDSFFAKAEVSVSKDVANNSSSNGSSSSTANVKTKYSVEITSNLPEYFSNYSVSQDGIIDFHSDMFNVETDVNSSADTTFKGTLPIGEGFDITSTGSLSTNLENGETTVTGRVTGGVRDNGVYFQGSSNITTGSTRVETGVRGSASTPKVGGFKISGSASLGVHWLFND